MNRPELRHTLIALIDAVRAPGGSGVVVTEAEIELPLEVTSAMHDGKLVFFCGPPHTRWVSGVLPQLHLGKLRVELAEAGCGE
jgi:hypothetical protein